MRGLLEILRRDRPVGLVVHNNPDPDALASALALKYLLGRRGFRRTGIYYEGLIGRAENKAMLTNLKMTVRLTRTIRAVRRVQLVLLDCQPGLGNVSLPEGTRPVAVIDHHPLRAPTRKLDFYDVRPGYGACSTILFEYLAEHDLALPGSVATALFHAISSETQSLGREGSPADRAAYQKLLPRVSFRLLSRIQYPALSKEFVAHLLGALSKAFYYKNLSGVILDELPYPDFVAEMADFLLRVQKIAWTICLGTHDDLLYVSLRSSRLGANAGKMIKRLVPRYGTSGGHGLIAGAQVRIDRSDPVKVAAVKESVVLKLLRVLNRGEVGILFNLVTDEPSPFPGLSGSPGTSPARRD